MKKIKRIGIKQAGKFAFVFYLFITLIIFLPIFLITFYLGGMNMFGTGVDSDTQLFGIFGGVFMLAVPLIYAVAGGIIVMLMSAFYNLVSKMTGGIELEIENAKTVNTETPDTTVLDNLNKDRPKGKTW